eukprot:6194051-Pleurochrysis_carterae.AAC.2
MRRARCACHAFVGCDRAVVTASARGARRVECVRIEPHRATAVHQRQCRHAAHPCAMRGEQPARRVKKSAAREGHGGAGLFARVWDTRVWAARFPVCV